MQFNEANTRGHNNNKDRTKGEAMPDLLHPFDADCGKCAGERSRALKTAGRWTESMVFRMYLCPDCGNKRCTKASDHDATCNKGGE